MKNIIIFLIFNFSNLSFSQIRDDVEKTINDKLNELSKKYKLNIVSYNVKKYNGVETISILYCDNKKLIKKVIDNPL